MLRPAWEISASLGTREYVMEFAILIGLALRWIHILSAITLMGGAVFQRFVLLPAAAALPDDTQQKLRAELRGRWSKLVMMTAGLLVVSGLVNFVLLVVNCNLDKTEWPGRLYHMMFGLKFLLALVVLYIASLLAGRSALAERARENARTWLTLNLVLATLVVCLGGVLRQAGRSSKQSPPPSTRTNATLSAPLERHTG